MQHATPTIGVVIVSFNTSALLRVCLQSLRGCSVPLRIVVVDNASQDDSPAMVRTCFPEVELHSSRDNIGFAAGNNLGLRQLGFTAAARSERTNADNLPLPAFCLLLNPDTIAHPGAIETLVAFLQAHPRVGLVGPRLLNPDGSIQPAAFRFPTLTMSVLEVFPPGEVLPGRLYNSWWHGRYHQERNGAAPFPVDHLLGACMLARREVIEQVGVFDESFFMYSEEVEWCWRIRQAGWAIWQAPQALVTHIGGASTRQFRRRMLVELHRSRVRFFRRYYGAGFYHAHIAITRVGMVRAMLLAWRDYARDRIEHNELRARLMAYGEICRL